MTSTAPRLVAPQASAGEPPLDPAQRGALEAATATRDPLMIIGAAGSGKTTLAVAAAVAAIDAADDPSRVLVIAPTRTAAASLRDRVSLAGARATGGPVVRTASSAAYAILRAQADALGKPRPTLVTGAEQDAILRDMLATHARGHGAAPEWAVVPREATGLPGFRGELRDLLMRASEAGMVPDDLAELGRRVGRPEWIAAAQVMREYESVMALRSEPADQGERYDPASVSAQAAWVIEKWERVAAGPVPAWDTVIVDDYQDATAAATALLRALAARGSRMVLIGNADEAVQGYRGAVPQALARASAAPADGGFGARHLALGRSHRQPPELAALADTVAQRIGTAGIGSARVAPVAGASAHGAPVAVVTAPHEHAQSRVVAAYLRRARHGLDGPAVPWGEMAVIARSAAQLRALRSDLLAADVPCASLGDAVALHRAPAVAPLLALVRVAAGEEWTEESASQVLGSRLIGLDPVAQRRLRRALAAQARAADDRRTAGELLVEALGDAAGWRALGGAEARAAARATAAVERAREATQRPGATPGQVVWAAWDALGLATQWRAAALAGSARDDEDLDAVIAVMKAAQQYSERMPGGTVEGFVAYLEGQEFAADSLGATAQGGDVVALVTPASAAGREWEVVAIAGLEEGLWPNLTLRDSVLGAQHLAELLAGRAQPEPLDEARRARQAQSARRAVLDDETRALLVALSRARQRVLLTCVEGDEQRPSRYLAWVEEAAGVARVPAQAIRGVSDLRAAVARLRVDAATDPDASARMLAVLVASGVPGADPSQWHGVPPLTTEEGFYAPGEAVRVSPSKVDTVETCALKWALESAGGVPQSSDKQLLGTLVHEIAAELPHGSHEELAARLEERWHELGLGDGWPDQMTRARADAMISRLAGYLASHERDEVRVEQAFSAAVDRAILAGSADRVEIADGKAHIVDLKTGAPISAADAEEHGQLAMYQLAASAGAFEGVDHADGAALVYLGGSAVSAAAREQAPIDVEAQRERLGAVVEAMTGGRFVATANRWCDTCPVRRACPAQPSGRQVSDG